MASSIHVAYMTGETAFRYTMRNDGAPKWATPLLPKNGTVTLSPFVNLRSRS